MTHVEPLTPGAGVGVQPCLPAAPAVPGGRGRAPGHRHHHRVVDVIILHTMYLIHRQRGAFVQQEVFVVCSLSSLGSLSRLAGLFIWSRRLARPAWLSEAWAERRGVLEDNIFHLVIT